VTYLLDTNAISDLMRAKPQIEDWISSLDSRDRLVTCVIVHGEIIFGISRLPDGKRRQELEETAGKFLESFPCEPVPANAGDIYAAVKLFRQRLGLSLDENDLWIAATSISLGATLVSRDSDFSGIDGLSLISLSNPR
jgi:predicted nucleic acid-binding protein